MQQILNPLLVRNVGCQHQTKLLEPLTQTVSPSHALKPDE